VVKAPSGRAIHRPLLSGLLAASLQAAHGKSTSVQVFIIRERNNGAFVDDEQAHVFWRHFNRYALAPGELKRYAEPRPSHSLDAPGATP